MQSLAQCPAKDLLTVIRPSMRSIAVSAICADTCANNKALAWRGNWDAHLSCRICSSPAPLAACPQQQVWELQAWECCLGVLCPLCLGWSLGVLHWQLLRLLQAPLA